MGVRIEADVCVRFNNTTSNFKARSDSGRLGRGGEVCFRQVLRLTTSLPDFFNFSLKVDYCGAYRGGLFEYCPHRRRSRLCLLRVMCPILLRNTQGSCVSHHFQNIGKANLQDVSDSIVLIGELY